jgi:hypothetical protein
MWIRSALVKMKPNTGSIRRGFGSFEKFMNPDLDSGAKNEVKPTRDRRMVQYSMYLHNAQRNLALHAAKCLGRV